jgi:uncharacterized glyoxalase superfamily protein PhnB
VAYCWESRKRSDTLPELKPNRSVPNATVIPVLTYPDVREAVAWLTATLGFTERVQIGENHRSQLSFGDGAVIVADVSGDRVPPHAGAVTHGVMLRVQDATALCDRARAHGATVVMEPTDFPFGERQAAVRDPFGHQWTFTETLMDVAPEEWGGTLLTGSVDPASLPFGVDPTLDDTPR